jgi:hypothetical protein
MVEEAETTPLIAWSGPVREPTERLPKKALVLDAYAVEKPVEEA